MNTKKDAWTLSGVIDDDLHFRCENVSPGGNLRASNGLVTITRTLHSLELVTERFDSPKAKRKRKAFEKRIGLKPASEGDADESFSFEATLVDCELPAVNAGTKTTWVNDFLGEWWSSSANSFVGELPNARYALIQAENKRDLEIYLRSKEGVRSPSEKDDWRQFRAFMAAVAFAAGMHPWPFRMRYMRGNHRISERISAARTPAKTDYSPFNRAIGRQESEAFGAAVRATTEFLQRDTPLTRQLVHLLFLFREAGKRAVQLEIRTLALCALLEGLLRFLFKDFGFEQASSLPKSKGRFVTAEQVFRSVARKMQISWTDRMEPLFNEWRRARNPSAHGDFRAELEPDTDEQQAAEQMFFGPSRVAGGFNMILLKLFGYRGVYRASTVEDIYRRL
ncbi:MAG TPA: hypothetical protein VJT50_02050 [Pyrinomonadaceae bacterium]|nr:hypothetical protein [Pyrinomonadaceae bacterium]